MVIVVVGGFCGCEWVYFIIFLGLVHNFTEKISRSEGQTFLYQLSLGHIHVYATIVVSVHHKDDELVRMTKTTWKGEAIATCSRKGKGKIWMRSWNDVCCSG